MRTVLRSAARLAAWTCRAGLFLVAWTARALLLCVAVAALALWPRSYAHQGAAEVLRFHRPDRERNDLDLDKLAVVWRDGRIAVGHVRRHYDEYVAYQGWAIVLPPRRWWHWRLDWDAPQDWRRDAGYWPSANQT